MQCWTRIRNTKIDWFSIFEFLCSTIEHSEHEGQVNAANLWWCYLVIDISFEQPTIESITYDEATTQERFRLGNACKFHFFCSPAVSSGMDAIWTAPVSIIPYVLCQMDYSSMRNERVGWSRMEVPVLVKGSGAACDWFVYLNLYLSGPQFEEELVEALLWLICIRFHIWR